MNMALFGGTFDPIHRGHLAIARAARRRFKLNAVYFVPADVPPHKQERSITAFEHRYAMVALATAEEERFIPSLLEAPPRYGNVLPYRASDPQTQVRPDANYSIDTVRRLKQQLSKNARVFFLIGIDAFLDIATWSRPEALLTEVEFIVASRPGYALGDVVRALPERLHQRANAVTSTQAARRKLLLLPGATIHLLDGLNEKVSATQIREAAQGKGPLRRYVGAAVADYIRKQNLYR
jgi:nicotinate-nucleotide adenylyltransferase